MEEDVLLQDLKNLKTQNVIVTGGSADNIVYVKGIFEIFFIFPSKLLIVRKI